MFPLHADHVRKPKAKARAQSVQSEADVDSDGDLQPVSRRTSPSVVDVLVVADGTTRRAAKRQGEVADDDLPFGQGKPKVKTHRA